MLRRLDLHPVRLGVFRCPTCGTYYDPTNGSCPGCAQKHIKLYTIYVAILVLMGMLFWLPMEVQVSAQVANCRASAVPCDFTPFVPTDTPVPTTVPTATPTDIVLQPIPRCAPIRNEKCVFLAFIAVR